MTDQPEESSSQSGTSMDIIAPRQVNPDDCRLMIRVTEVSEEVIGGTITEIMERGFGFKDYINVGDSKEFKLSQEVPGLKKDMLVMGIIRTIGNSRNTIYDLKEVEIIKR